MRQAVDAMVSLVVYDVLGREVARLVQEKLRAGTHRTPYPSQPLNFADLIRVSLTKTILRSTLNRRTFIAEAAASSKRFPAHLPPATK